MPLLENFMGVIKDLKFTSLAFFLIKKDIEVMHPELEVKLRTVVVEAKTNCLMDLASKHFHGST